MAYPDTRKIHKKRKHRGGTIRRTSISPLTDDDSSIDIDELVVKKTLGYKSPTRNNKRSLSNNQCVGRIEKEQQLCKYSIKQAMKFASDQCDAEIKTIIKKYKPKSAPKKKTVRKPLRPWRP